MTVIIILAAFTLILGLIEIFITPGFGLAGIGSIICALADVVLIYTDYGFGWACGAVVIGLVVLGIMLYIVAHSRTFDRMSLHTAITSTNATIGGKQVEVKSSGEFINPGTPVRVISVSEATIIVEKTNE